MKIFQFNASVEVYSTYWAEPRGEPGGLLYVALGDSAAQGIGASSPERGYVGCLQQLFEMLPSYCEKTIGFPPGPAEAHSTLIARPPSATPDDKLPVGAFGIGGQLVGC